MTKEPHYLANLEETLITAFIFTKQEIIVIF
jgi:hypothetical protein